MSPFCRKQSMLIPVGITALVTAAIVTWVLYLTGLPGHTSSSPPADSTVAADQMPSAPGTGERAIIYWRAPMDPMEIYDKPGKSKMGMDLVPVYADEVEDTGGESAQRKVVYWRAPMDPLEIYDAPGQSKMGMDLVPVYDDELVGGVEVRIDPVVEQNMGLRTAIASQGPLEHTIHTYGRITQDETRTGIVTQKVDGWIETLYANYTGFAVKKDDPLYDLYAPILVSAQEEYLSAFSLARSNPGSMNQTLLASARQRLIRFNVHELEIKALEASGTVSRTILIRSPYTGIVIHKNAVEGAFMKTGTPVFTLADFSTVWVEAHIFEYEQNLVFLGQSAEMFLSYDPQTRYTGTISYIFPYLQPRTRDVVVRIEFSNPDLSLKPDMFARVSIHTGNGRTGLRIPSEAVIHAGDTDLVFVAEGKGRFTPRTVTTGLSLDNGDVQILSGLAAGDRVVTSGQFLLDSESRLKEAIQKMMKPERETPGPDDTDDQDFFNDMDDTTDDSSDMGKDARS